MRATTRADARDARLATARAREGLARARRRARPSRARASTRTRARAAVEGDAGEDVAARAREARRRAEARAEARLAETWARREGERDARADAAEARDGALAELESAREALRRAREDKEIVEATLARTREDSARRADAAATETETLRRELEKVLDALDGEKKEKALVEERFASERERLSDEAVDEAKRLQAKLDDASVAIERATQARDAIEEQMADAVASNAATKDETLQLKKQLDDAVHALSDAIIEKSSAESKIAETEARNQELEKAKASMVSKAELDCVKNELKQATLGRTAAVEDSERLADMLQAAKRELEILALDKKNLQQELAEVVAKPPQVSAGDIELFEQLVASQKEELATLRDLADTSMAKVNELEEEIDRLLDQLEERDAELEEKNRATTSPPGLIESPIVVTDGVVVNQEARSYADLVEETVRAQLMDTIEVEATSYIDEQDKRLVEQASGDARKTTDGVYYFVGDVRPSTRVRLIYNRETTSRMSRDGQVFAHVGFNGWRLGVSKKIGMTPLAHDAKERDIDHRVRDQGSWWICEVEIPPGASTVEFVFSDANGFYDNNSGKDYHCPVDVENLPREHRISARIKAETERRRDAIEKCAKRAGKRAARHAEMRATALVRASEGAALMRVHTVPYQGKAGGEMTIVYRAEGGPLGDAQNIFCEGSWNRWNHGASFGPSVMQRGDTPGTLELTVNVPADAHVMDFKFLNEDVASPQTRYDSNNGADYHAPVTGGSGAAPKLNVVHIAVEMAPICKVGGMGDVVTALARATQEDGHNVEVIVPHYDCMLFDAVDGYHRAGSCVHHDVQVDVFKGWVEDVPVTLLRPKNGHFDVGCIYGRHDDHVRFGFFTEAALTWMRSKNKEVDIIHAHDWQTAPATWGNYPKAATALTLHNLQFGVDLIRRGMESCDIATTVSPTYADEVRSHHAVAPSQDKFVGIRNGIDTDIWNPSADEFLPLVYDSSNAIAGKAAAAAELCRRLGIQHPEGAPIVGVVSRLTAQKGIHLIKHACHRALERGATFVLLGSAPDPAHQHEFNALADEMKRKYPGRSGFMFKYDEPLSHLIYAGCDFLLVPSMFEPCGLTQMIAMRYGTVPVVRRTGGLRDTVFDVENDGERSAMTGVPLNGFVFDGTETPDIDYALNRALDAFYDRPRWQSLNLVERTLNLDWSWFEPAKRYEDLYWASLRHKRGR